MPDCPTCGKSLKTQSGIKSHHATVHGESLAKVSVECDYCKEQTEKYKDRVERSDNDFCSRECRRKFNEEEGNGFAKLKDNVTVSCEECGTEKEVQHYKFENQDSFYCGYECMGESKKATRIEIDCTACGDSLVKLESQIEDGENYYCSNECKYESMKNRVIVECSYCGEEKEVPESKQDLNKTGEFFCDQQCQTEFYNECEWPVEVDRVTVPCHYCENELTMRKTEVGKYEKRFCNPECMGKWRETLTQEEHPSWNRVKVDCWWCGSELNRKPSQIQQSEKERQFCNQQCHGKWRSYNNIHPQDPVPDKGGKAFIIKEEIESMEQAEEKTREKLDF